MRRDARRAMPAEVDRHLVGLPVIERGQHTFSGSHGRGHCQFMKRSPSITPDKSVVQMLWRICGLLFGHGRATYSSLLKKVGFASTASCVFPEEFDASMCHLWAFFNGLRDDPESG